MISATLVFFRGKHVHKIVLYLNKIVVSEFSRAFCLHLKDWEIIHIRFLSTNCFIWYLFDLHLCWLILIIFSGIIFSFPFNESSCLLHFFWKFTSNFCIIIDYSNEILAGMISSKHFSRIFIFTKAYYFLFEYFMISINNIFMQKNNLY